jgi:hypothetical protein
MARDYFGRLLSRFFPYYEGIRSLLETLPEALAVPLVRRRNKPSRKRLLAAGAIEQLYPDGVPDTLVRKEVCFQIAKRLAEQGHKVSDTHILRALRDSRNR